MYFNIAYYYRYIRYKRNIPFILMLYGSVKEKVLCRKVIANLREFILFFSPSLKISPTALHKNANHKG